MKETPLTNTHISLGAKMAEFAGYNMPISYSGIIEEHNRVRNSVGLFDVSHMGEFILKGTYALELIQDVTSNDASILEIGDAQYSCMPNKAGGIVDDLLVYRLAEDKCSEGERAYMLVVNAGNIDKDWGWISNHNKYGVEMTDISSKTGLLALQGPKAKETLQKLTDINLDAIEYYKFEKGRVGGIDNVLVSATGYTGAGGFEIYLDNKDIKTIWDQLIEAGGEFGILPAGLGCRDTLRLEMGFCLYGNDIDDNTSPLEAGLGWITKLKKPFFISKDKFVRQKESGLEKKLVGMKMEGKRVPRHGYEIQNLTGDVIGVVTSGTMSPTLDYPIAMGYINTKLISKEGKVNVMINGKPFLAQITKVPFI